jgi:hypothetical protein
LWAVRCIYLLFSQLNHNRYSVFLRLRFESYGFKIPRARARDCPRPTRNYLVLFKAVGFEPQPEKNTLGHRGDDVCAFEKD